jgi:CHRD domain-containing protein
VDKTMSRRAVMVLGGVISAAAAVGLAQAAPQTFSVPLTGAQQVPKVASPGTGTANFTWDPATRGLSWSITFNGLSSPATMAHIHSGGAGKNGGVVFWLSTRGTPPASPFTGSATLTPAQARQLAAGAWYVNLHSKDHPAGELRGQVVPPKG